LAHVLLIEHLAHLLLIEHVLLMEHLAHLLLIWLM